MYIVLICCLDMCVVQFLVPNKRSSFGLEVKTPITVDPYINVFDYSRKMTSSPFL